jgi:hypothetical protein
VEELSNIKGITVNPTLSLPLVNAEANIGDLSGKLSDKARIEADANKLLMLVFEDRDSLAEDQYFTIPPVNANFNVIMPPTEVPAFEANGYFSFSQQSTVPITMSGNQRIERVLVKSGSMNFVVGSSFQHNTTVKITYPGITKNGVALVDSFVFIYNGTPLPNINRNIDISGYEVDCTNNGSTYNTFPFEAKVDIIRNPANGVALTDNISFSQALNISEYKRVEGYFGKFTIANFSQRNILGVFDKKIDGSLFLNDPRLHLKIDNTFGIPITAKITEMYVLSGNGTQIPITIEQFKDTFSLEYTTNIGQSKITTYTIDKTNSNIDQILSAAPQEIVYQVTFFANDDDIVQTNVLYDYTTVKQEAKLELPFDMKVLNYTIESQGPFSLGATLADMDTSGFTINWAEVQTQLNNAMPMAAFVQMYLEDSLTGTLYDSVFDPYYLIPGATVDANGTIVSPTSALSTTLVNEQRLANFKRANQYRLQITLKTSESSTNQPFVKFFDDQKLKARLGLKVNATYKQ